MTVAKPIYVNVINVFLWKTKTTAVLQNKLRQWKVWHWSRGSSAVPTPRDGPLVVGCGLSQARAASIHSGGCVWLFFDPMNSLMPGSSVHGILQARILQWVATSFPQGSSRPRDRTHVSCRTSEPPGKLDDVAVTVGSQAVP